MRKRRVSDSLFGVTVLGADLAKYTTLRATTLYVTPDGTYGAPFAAGKELYGSTEVQNGRRKMNMNVGGTDYWVPITDVAPVIDINKRDGGVPNDYYLSNGRKVSKEEFDRAIMEDWRKGILPGAPRPKQKGAEPGRPWWHYALAIGLGTLAAGGAGYGVYRAVKR